MIIDNCDDIRAAQAVGLDAKPTGRLRQLTTRTAGRLQQEWRGEFGVIWLDVPLVKLDVLPERTALKEGGRS
jgi:hypothetical protein